MVRHLQVGRRIYIIRRWYTKLWHTWWTQVSCLLIKKKRLILKCATIWNPDRFWIVGNKQTKKKHATTFRLSNGYYKNEQRYFQMGSEIKKNMMKNFVCTPFTSACYVNLRIWPNVSRVSNEVLEDDNAINKFRPLYTIS